MICSQYTQKFSECSQIDFSTFLNYCKLINLDHDAEKKNTLKKKSLKFEDIRLQA